MSELRKLRALTWPERRLLFLALVLLPMTALSLRLIGFRRTYAAMAAAGGDSPMARDKTLLRAHQTARIVAAAARFGPYKASCLPLALTLRQLLQRQGIEAQFRLGVAKGAKRFEAHAWVEYQGLALPEDQNAHGRFAAFDGAILPGAATPK